MQTTDVDITLSTNHWGSFELKICPMDSNLDEIATQECMDEHVLEVIEDNEINVESKSKGGRKENSKPSDFVIAEETKRHNETFAYRVKLPGDISCKRCVMQWTYTTGKFIDRLCRCWEH